MDFYQRGLDYSYRIFNIDFQNYTCHEIKKMSIKEIYNMYSFDALGNPIRGGLYDPELGPQKPGENCEKCGLSYSCVFGDQITCPGHMGHIQLPLPVFNPLTFQAMIQLLKTICLDCGVFLKRPSQCYIFLKQILALDVGLITLVDEMENEYRQCLSEMKDEIDKSSFEMFKKRIDDRFLHSLENNQQSIRKHSTKHIEDIRSAFIKKFRLIRNNRCFKCNKKAKSLRHEHYARIYFRSSKLKVLENQSDMTRGEMVSYQDIITASQAKKLLRQLYQNQPQVVEIICGFPDGMNFVRDEKDLESSFVDTFFVDMMLVPPPRMRPVSVLRFTMAEHQHSVNFKKIIQASQDLRDLIKNMNEEKVEGKMSVTQLMHNQWFALQLRVNASFDQSICKIYKDTMPGIKQLIEKKAGLLRTHMMGKRVNFSARSVLSPDPYISTNEVIIPEVFAKKLFFTEFVSPRNFQQIKNAVINGPDVHPGAAFVHMENDRMVSLQGKTRDQREAIANQLLTPTVSHGVLSFVAKKVKRHLCNGDLMLLNRQPTLHRPSIQGFKARVLKTEKTIRINYTPCKAFNADFDGDEMNVHFPQNYIARAEAANLALADYQYLVPKDGMPIAGLIQDHMVSGVLLSMRGRFFIERDYHDLVCAALVKHTARIQLLPPSILKPVRMWSGKQVISTMLINITPKGQKPLSLFGLSKIADKDWINGKKSANLDVTNYKYLSENIVIFRQGQFLTGILDKNHFGATAFGLVHSCYELYGGEISGKLLTSLGRLFVFYLRVHHSFTMDITDILIKEEGESARRKEIWKLDDSGHEVMCRALQMNVNSTDDDIRARIEKVHFSKLETDRAETDGAIKSQLNRYQDNIQKSCWPHSLFKAFPYNSLQLMVASGAKGSMVNCMQISCLLGQVDLEGCRPPLMLNGASLPSFAPYDLSPKSGGFVDNRFLTGLNQQEFFFHCMAGREGLVDTAVKTSRSGYLQRCLIKHLEGLLVAYDATVRDSDGSIIQFNYGEDGLDVIKTSYLNQKQIPFLLDNREILEDKIDLNEPFLRNSLDLTSKLNQKINSFSKKNRTTTKPFIAFCQKNLNKIVEDLNISEMTLANRDLICVETSKRFITLSEEVLEKLNKRSHKILEPCSAIMRPDLNFGCTSEKFYRNIEEYIASNSEQITRDGKLSIESFKNILYSKYQRAMIQPGEAVGVLAATSVGEQTTQMTLNTFHFAGHGAMNVTLGVPRLREILMLASESIKTPIMNIPVLCIDDKMERRVQRLAKRMKKIHLDQLIESIEIKKAILTTPYRCRQIVIRFNIRSASSYRDELDFKPSKVIRYLEHKFFLHISKVFEKQHKEMKDAGLLVSHKIRQVFHRKKASDENDEGNNDKDKEATAKDDEATADAAFNNDDNDDDDEEEDNDIVTQKIEDYEESENDEVDGSGDEAADNNSLYGNEDADGNSIKTKKLKKNDELDATIDKITFKKEKFSNDEIFHDDVNDADNANDANVDEEEEEEDCDVSRSKIRKLQQSEKKIEGLLSRIPNLKKYAYDSCNYSWCETTFEFSLNSKEMDIHCIIDREIKRTTITRIQGISNCALKDIALTDCPDWMVQSAAIEQEKYLQNHPGENRKRKRLQIEGINIWEILKYQDKLDVNEILMNNIQTMAKIYGIEAAAQVVIYEIRSVFKVYGIDVDYRHLSLLADYMTYEGSFKGFNRAAMASNASPLQKMSFESAMGFLRSAIIDGARDNVESPTSRLMVGRPIRTGTGCFDIIQPIHT